MESEPRIRITIAPLDVLLFILLLVWLWNGTPGLTVESPRACTEEVPHAQR